MLPLMCVFNIVYIYISCKHKVIFRDSSMETPQSLIKHGFVQPLIFRAALLDALLRPLLSHLNDGDLYLNEQ